MIGDTVDIQTILWALMALLIVGGAVLAARQRASETKSRGPGVVLSLLIWGGLIAFVVLLVQGAEFWARLASLFS
ncbi:MAG: hypothetical protein ABL889_02440 [Terricaulis sp.]